MNSFIAILKQTEIFQGLNQTQLELIAAICSERTCQTDEVIFLEGATSDELYVIAAGEVDIQINPALVSKTPSRALPSSTIASLTRGQCFGEIALVDQGVRSATARAAQKNTRVLVLPSEKLLGLCASFPELGYLVMSYLAADMALKMRNTDLLIREELLYSGIRKR